MNVLTKAPQSQFAYVVLASRRARQIMAGAPPLVENPRTAKATRIACEELEHSMLEYDFVEPTSIDMDKDGNKRRKEAPGFVAVRFVATRVRRVLFGRRVLVPLWQPR